MTEDICGYSDTESGDPCQNHPSESDGLCWMHSENDSNKNQGKLHKNAEIPDLMAEEINRGATISEALAEVEGKTGIMLPRSTHDNWMSKGKTSDKDSIYSEYRSKVRRARTIGKRTDRETLKQICRENDDTRTWWKIHKEQYGDLYDGESDPDTGGAPFAIPEELVEEWQQNAPTPQ